MNNLSKTPVSLVTAQGVVREHFGGAQKIATFEELKDGYFNSAYHVSLQDGFHFVLKAAPLPEIKILRYEKDILRTEVETMRLVKSRTEMPVPAVYLHDETCSLLPSPYYCMEFINGTPLHKIRENLSPTEVSAIDQSCGHFLRQMNNITSGQFGCYANPQNALVPWSAAFLTLLEDVLQDGLEAGVELPLPAREFTEMARLHSACLDEVVTPSLVHWDLWDGNIFIDTQTGRVNGIIDFERSLWADPLMEVNFGAFGINQDFLAGYGQAYPFSPSQQIRRTLYNIYLFLIMVIETTYRAYPTKDQENWARQRLGVEMEKLDQIPSQI